MGRRKTSPELPDVRVEHGVFMANQISVASCSCGCVLVRFLDDHGEIFAAASMHPGVALAFIQNACEATEEAGFNQVAADKGAAGCGHA